MTKRLICLLLFLLLPASSLPALEEICEVCGKPIGETIYLLKDSITNEKKRVCGKCVELTTTCYLCGLPVKKDQTELPDGRLLCARDAKSVVLDDNEAKRICTETKEALDRHLSRFMTFPDTNLTFAIADRVSLLEFYKTPGEDYECPNVLGYMQTRTNGGHLQHQISVLSGLQPGVLRATYAHECAHAWIAENVGEKRRAAVSRDSIEGFCELVAHFTAGVFGDNATQQFIMRNNYTRGQISLFVETERRFGLNDVLEWMKFGEDNQLTGDLDRIRLVAAPATGTEQKPARPPAQPLRPAQPVYDKLAVRGITLAGARSLATINNQCFAIGEEAKVSLNGSNATVRCLEIRADSVLIQLQGSDSKQELKLTPNERK